VANTQANYDVAAIAAIKKFYSTVSLSSSKNLSFAALVVQHNSVSFKLKLPEQKLPSTNTTAYPSLA
jgi:hypothetical protein